MSGFASIIDITSFFIGILINLLLIAMICFYFKRKIDNLENSQSEQAKILFQLLQQNNTTKNIIIEDNDLENQNMNNEYSEDFNNLNNEGGNAQDNEDAEEEESDLDDSDDGSDDDSDDDDESDDDIEKNKSDEPVLNEPFEIKKIVYEENDTEENTDYQSMTVKQLKQVLEEKGLKGKNLRKNEMIDLIKDSKEIPSQIEEIHEEPLAEVTPSVTVTEEPEVIEELNIVSNELLTQVELNTEQLNDVNINTVDID